MLNFPRWKVLTVLAGVLISLVLAAPNLFTEEQLAKAPSWVPARHLSLGLDLQGGSHLLLEVDVDSVVRERMTNLQDSLRAELRRANIAYTDLVGEGTRITLKLRPDADREAARRAILAADQALDVQIAADGTTVLSRTAQDLALIRQSALQQSLEIIRRRVDETGTREPSIQQQGQNRILVQLPGVRDPERIKSLIGTTAKLTFRMVEGTVPAAEARGGRPPAGTDYLPGDPSDPRSQGISYIVSKRILVSGESLVDAQPTFQDGMAVVSFRFDSVGARRFGDATTQNVGRPFAIVLDNKVISAPVIREPITGGRGVISGSFTTQSASDLALLLRAGALPAPLTVIEERTVGPDLGADSIRAGAIASAFGYLLIAVLMVGGYGLFGIYANIALAMNLVITVAVMSLLQATLTLPGIAGMVLGLAMAVDANVLIYERMREEQAAGRSVYSTIDVSFNRAFLTIVDSNLTTLVAALFLYIFGSGPVRGFAVTLAIGIVASMFTAVLLTRLMVVTWVRAKRRTSLPI